MAKSHEACWFHGYNSPNMWPLSEITVSIAKVNYSTQLPTLQEQFCSNILHFEDQTRILSRDTLSLELSGTAYINSTESSAYSELHHSRWTAIDATSHMKVGRLLEIVQSQSLEWKTERANLRNTIFHGELGWSFVVSVNPGLLVGTEELKKEERIHPPNPSSDDGTIGWLEHRF